MTGSPDGHLPTRHREEPYNLTQLRIPAHEVLPTSHRAMSLYKRLHGATHQGGIQGHQLDSYLDEFVFRYNRRSSRHRGRVFWQIVCALLSAKPVPQAQITVRQDLIAELDTIALIGAHYTQKELDKAKHRKHQAAYAARVRAGQPTKSKRLRKK